MTAGMLDPFIAGLLQQLSQLGAPPIHTLSPAQAREQMNAVALELLEPPEDVMQIEDMDIPGAAGPIPIRVYTPQGRAPFPVLVYFHGGGWVVCNLDTHDSICRALANGAACVVVSVDYRLAPEDKFPAAIEDAYAATQWVADNASRMQGDPSQIAVGGDSAGGNLAAVVCLLARDKGSPSLVYQLLVYPVTDLSSMDTDSYRRHGEGYILTKEDMEWYSGHYLESEQDAQDPRASPLLAPDLNGLPPALVMAAEFDVLRDEDRAYAERLEQAGVPVQYTECEGMIHAFFGLAGMDRTRNGIGKAVDALRSAFP